MAAAIHPVPTKAQTLLRPFAPLRHDAELQIQRLSQLTLRALESLHDERRERQSLGMEHAPTLGSLD